MLIKRTLKGLRKKIKREEKIVQYVVKTAEKPRFSGKRIIVTGGTGAIGSAICLRLLIEGATVGVCGRNRDKLNAHINRLESLKVGGEGTCVPLILDVTDDKSIEFAIDSFVEQVGGIDALVNNAGGSARAENRLVCEQEISIIDNVIDTNLRGSIVCARKVVPFLMEQRYGKIINMSSVVGLHGKATMSDYASAKLGIVGFTKSLALEVGEFNITCNCVSPGMVNQVPFDGGMDIRPTKKNCLKRFGYTDEVASLVAFVLSDEANYITGHNFVIDGGRTLGLMGD